MSLTTTRAPSAANASACARPMPPPAPVTMTTRPSSKPISDVSLTDCVRCGQVVRRLTATVYFEARTTDVRRGVRREKRCGPTDIGRLGEPAERHILRDGRDGLFVAVEQFGLFGLDHADDHGVDPDLRCPLDSQCAGEAFDTGLGGTVRRRPWRRPTSADAGDVHDRP